MKKIGFIGILIIIAAALSCGLSFIVTYLMNIFKIDGVIMWQNLIAWAIFLFILIMLIFDVTLSHKIIDGMGQQVLFFISASLLISFFIGSVIFILLECEFDFAILDWPVFYNKIAHGNPKFLGIVALTFIIFMVIYCSFIDRRVLNFLGSGGLRGTGKLKQIASNLENSRWMNEKEKQSIFKSYKFSQLSKVKKDGIPIAAKLTKNEKDMEVMFNSPCHSIIIGSTGSGKTTTFVSPMIQLIANTAAGSSMIVTDPKGELFSLHSKILAEKGYDVKVIDLRDTYASYRWNPLDNIWDMYQRYAFAHKLAEIRSDDAVASGFKLTEPAEAFKGKKWYAFDNTAFLDYNKLVEAVQIFKKKTFDECYEDLNDLVSVLIPIENEKDPMWEKGARSITLAVLLAMLEDSEIPELEMTKEKFNFFNMTKILQNSSNDYIELRNYFAGRNVLSKAYSLSKQVCDAAENTRSSYMSVLYDKLTMFNDAGICALTSSSDFTSEQLAYKPTALFLKIPDEKDTRHNLAAIFILNIYKTLIKVASAKPDLTLDRNVYFIMDEFGNMPKIEKFDKFITVGRSRKIWFTMIIQSYAQLNNVYGDTVADIVKGNCGIKMFIGSNDMNTCKEYSELCGNITVVTTSTSGSTQSTDVNISSQTQVRPLIYPSELQRLNHPGDIGHSIIVTFGNFPLKTYFSPSFKVSLYKMGKMDTSDISERMFDEDSVAYSVANRNEIILNESDSKEESQVDDANEYSNDVDYQTEEFDEKNDVKDNPQDEDENQSNNDSRKEEE